MRLPWLITKGKVYDADGKAFIGQHMKSVSGFPDNQGDADNIQLLSQEEHLEAHKGDWHNSVFTKHIRLDIRS